MKCKVFYFSSINDSDSRERSINEWLSKQKSITIEHITTVPSGSDRSFLYLFYSTRKGKLEILNDIGNE